MIIVRLKTDRKVSLLKSFSAHIFIERCISYKFNDDLPEMTTCCKYKDGRYAIWRYYSFPFLYADFRDDPKREELYIVHVTKDDHFPSIQVRSVCLICLFSN